MTDDEILELKDKTTSKEPTDAEMLEFAKAILKKEREDFTENIEGQMRRIDWSICPSEVLDNLLFSLRIRSKDD